MRIFCFQKTLWWDNLLPSTSSSSSPCSSFEFGNLLNTDMLVLRTVFHVPSSYIFSKFNAFNKDATWHDDFDIADPSSTQDACHTWTLYMAQHATSPSVPHSSVLRASNRCTETQTSFFVPSLVTCWSHHSFLHRAFFIYDTSLIRTLSMPALSPDPLPPFLECAY